MRVQTCKGIKAYFDKYMAPILRNDKSKLVAKDEQKLKKQQRKTYEYVHLLLVIVTLQCTYELFLFIDYFAN